MLALAIGLCLAAPQEEALTFDSLLAPLASLRAEEDWKGLQQRLLEILTTREGDAEVFVHRPQILEDLLRSAFWDGREAPEVADIISGDLVRWSPATGNVKLRYGPTNLDDFHVLETTDGYFEKEGFDADDIYLHMLPFAGPYTISISGKRYPRLDEPGIPRIMVGWDNETGFMVVPGFADPGGPTGKSWIPALMFEMGEKKWEELDRGDSPAKGGKPYMIKAQLSASSIVGSVNGRKVLKARKPRDLFGRVGFSDFHGMEEILLEGKAEASWFDGLVDRTVQDQWIEFCKDTDESTLLPQWLLLDEREWEDEKASHEDLPGSGPVTEARAAPLQRVLDVLDSDPVEALKRAKRIEEDPLMSWALALVSAANLKREQALDYCIDVLDQDPDFAAAQRLAVELEVALGRSQAALERCLGLVHDDPQNSFGHSRLALLALLEGDAEQARSAVLEGAKQGAYDGRLELANRMRVRAHHGPSWRSTFESRSEHYIIRSSLDQNICDTAAHVLETALEHYKLSLGPSVAVPERRFPVYIFSGEASYQAYLVDILLGPAENTAGVYLPHLKQLLIWNVPAREDMIRTIRHEGFHQYLDAVAPDAPAWLHEGFAEYWEAADFSKMRSRQAPVREDHRRHLLRHEIKLTPLETFLRQDSAAFMRDPGTHYAQAWAWIYFLRHTTRANRDLLDDFLQRLVNRQPWQEAVDASFGDADLEGLQAELEAYLHAMD